MYINSHYPFDKISLNYNFNEFEPVISYNTFFVHYNKLYLSYLNKLNSLLENQPNYQNLSLDELLFNANILTSDISKDIIYNAGGVYNHQIFFESLCPNTKDLGDSNLKDMIISTFGSIDQFKEQLKTYIINFKGSGYIFLVCNEHNRLSLFPVINQDTTVPFNLCPLMCIDCWEHSYFCDLENNKEQYAKFFIEHINWDIVSSKYDNCLKYILN